MGLVLMADEAHGSRDAVSGVTDHHDPARSDADLVAALSNGDRSAFAALYDRHSAHAYSLAHRLCAGFAEDIVQRSFLGLWRAPERYEPGRGDFSSWLLTVVHQHAVEIIRNQNEQPGKADAVNSVTDVDVLASLSSEQRTVLRLAYFGARTQNEVAELTGIPVDTVKSRTFSALRKLRIALSPVHGGLAI